MDGQDNLLLAFVVPFALAEGGLTETGSFGVDRWVLSFQLQPQLAFLSSQLPSPWL